MPNGIPPWHTPTPQPGMFNPEELERQREMTFNYMSQNTKLRKESRDAKAQIYKQNWDAYNDYFQEMSKLKQQLSDLEYSESEKHAAASQKGEYYATPLPVQQKIGQMRNQIQTLDYENFKTGGDQPATPSDALAAGAAEEPVAVGTYADQFGYREPVAMTKTQPFGKVTGATEPIDLYEREALPGTVPGGYFNQMGQVTTSATDEFGNPITGPSGGQGVYGEGGTVLNPELGVAGRSPLETYEGPAGVPTPGSRGFATYDQLRLGMEAAGRPINAFTGRNTDMFSPGWFQERYDNQYSPADSLQQFLGNARGRTYRGLMRQRVDLGQGVQDYRVRRDAYGNVRSFMPERSSQLTPDERLFRRY